VPDFRPRVTAIVPDLMLAAYIVGNIPMFNSPLHDHYGGEFDEYAHRTCKLVPFLY
jgi:hypothetical protein